MASQLILASEHGDIETVRTLLDMGVSPSCRDENSTLVTPLIQAARHGHVEVVQLLVSRGAKLEDRDPDIGGTALFHAAINGWEETVRVLVKLGSDPNAPEWTGCTPVFAASFHGHVEVVHLLLDSGGKLDSPCPSGTPLHAAVEGRQIRVLKMLLVRGAPPDGVDTVGRSALWIACQAGYVKSMAVCLIPGFNFSNLYLLV
jgi:ankyrin repeat protein